MKTKILNIVQLGNGLCMANIQYENPEYYPPTNSTDSEVNYSRLSKEVRGKYSVVSRTLTKELLNRL